MYNNFLNEDIIRYFYNFIYLFIYLVINNFYKTRYNFCFIKKLNLI